MKIIKSLVLLSGLAGAAAALSIDDWKAVSYAETLSVYLNGKAAGTMVCAVGVTGDTIVVESALHTEVSSGGTSPIVASVIEKRYYAASGQIIGADQEFVSPAGSNQWKLDKNVKDEWLLTVTAGGVKNSRVIQNVTDNALSTYEMAYGIKTRTLKTGMVWRDTILEFTSGEKVTTTVTCTEAPSGENDSLWKFTERNSITGKDELWVVDKNVKTVSREIFPFEIRRGELQAADTMRANIFETFMIPAQRPAADNEKIVINADSSFQLDTSVSVFYRKVKGGYELIAQSSDCGKGSSREVSDSLKLYLKATTTMQVDHPAIKKLAADIASKGSVCDRIGSMNAYVFNHLEKKYTATFSSALETLNAGFGDCGEHAVLLAALLRASGIPARVIFGVVFMPNLKGYYYHAWVLAHTGEKWIFADPALGVYPANKDRLPFVIDDSGEKMLALAKVIGRLSVVYVK